MRFPFEGETWIRTKTSVKNTKPFPSTDFSAMFACSWFVPRVRRFPRIFVWTTWPETLWPRGIGSQSGREFHDKDTTPLSHTTLRLQWKGMSQKVKKGGRARIPWQRLIFAYHVIVRLSHTVFFWYVSLSSENSRKRNGSKPQNKSSKISPAEVNLS